MPDHIYSVLMDGRVIVTHTDTEGVHPVYAITLMGDKLSQLMIDAGKETVSESLEEARKVMGLDADKSDALAMLRGQEPVEPHVEHDSDDDSWYYECGVCHEAIDYKDKFCRHCGRKVKWDEAD